jgi:hypothetical protein
MVWNNSKLGMRKYSLSNLFRLAAGRRAGQSPVRSHRLREKRADENNSLWFRDSHESGNGEQCENPVCPTYKPSCWLPTRVEPDMTPIEQSEQQQAEAGSHEPHGIGGPDSIYLNRKCHVNGRHQA